MENLQSQSNSAEAPSPSGSVARWGQERRLEFIDFRLQWDGRINRSDLTEFFGISAPQASADIARYRALAPDNADYDGSSKTYLVGKNFVSQFGADVPARYLNELLASEAGVLLPGATFLGSRPEIGVVPSPNRTLALDTLLMLLRAIRERTTVRMQYQSMSHATPRERTVSPHALAHDGSRWHVRAYCSERQDYRDFVIARISELEELRTPGKGAEDDHQWHRILRLVLEPHPGLTEGQRRAIELDYGMQDGTVVLECRHALVFYFLRRFHVMDADESGASRQQIVLKNRAELAPYLNPQSEGL
ncbi:helix-turn-helix transcriptional regulator [Cupriavidus sp. TMH.W2]|uniref:helix-turn-helix transcriptional regulator n=1 Tax=Cupriavidus sp. TMH.W2 TaxID=3434465 RepID=UPI003D781CC9